MARDIDLGDKGNILDNATANIEELFKLYQNEELGIRLSKIYNEDIRVPVAKSVAIDIEGVEASRENRAISGFIQHRYTLYITVAVWYYHEEMDVDVRKKDVQNILWKIAKMFMNHTTCNGFVPKLGTEVLGTEYLPRRFDNKIMAGGVVRLRLTKLYTVSPVD
jgi:hypothetical protein